MQSHKIDMIEIDDTKKLIFTYLIKLFGKQAGANEIDMRTTNDKLHTQALIITQIAKITGNSQQNISANQIKEIMDYLDYLETKIVDEFSTHSKAKLHIETVKEFKLNLIPKIADFYFTSKNLPSDDELSKPPFLNRNAYIFVKGTHDTCRVYHIHDGKKIEVSASSGPLFYYLNGLEVSLISKENKKRDANDKINTISECININSVANTMTLWNFIIQKSADFYFTSYLPSDAELSSSPYAGKNAYIFLKGPDSNSCHIYQIYNGKKIEINVSDKKIRKELFSKLEEIEEAIAKDNKKRNPNKIKNTDCTNLNSLGLNDLVWPFIYNENSSSIYSSVEGMVRLSATTQTKAETINNKAIIFNEKAKIYHAKSALYEGITQKLYNFLYGLTSEAHYKNLRLIHSKYALPENKSELRQIIISQIKNSILPLLQQNIEETKASLKKLLKDDYHQIDIIEGKIAELNKQRTIVKNEHDSDSVSSENQEEIKKINAECTTLTDNLKQIKEQYEFYRNKINNLLGKLNSIEDSKSPSGINEEYLEKTVNDFIEYIKNRDKLLAECSSKNVASLKFGMNKIENYTLKSFKQEYATFDYDNNSLLETVIISKPNVDSNKKIETLSNSSNKSTLTEKEHSKVRNTAYVRSSTATTTSNTVGGVVNSTGKPYEENIENDTDDEYYEGEGERFNSQNKDSASMRNRSFSAENIPADSNTTTSKNTSTKTKEKSSRNSAGSNSNKDSTPVQLSNPSSISKHSNDEKTNQKRRKSGLKINRSEPANDSTVRESTSDNNITIEKKTKVVATSNPSSTAPLHARERSMSDEKNDHSRRRKTSAHRKRGASISKPPFNQESSQSNPILPPLSFMNINPSENSEIEYGRNKANSEKKLKPRKLERSRGLERSTSQGEAQEKSYLSTSKNLNTAIKNSRDVYDAESDEEADINQISIGGSDPTPTIPRPIGSSFYKQASSQAPTLFNLKSGEQSVSIRPRIKANETLKSSALNVSSSSNNSSATSTPNTTTTTTPASSPASSAFSTPILPKKEREKETTVENKRETLFGSNLPAVTEIPQDTTSISSRSSNDTDENRDKVEENKKSL